MSGKMLKALLWKEWRETRLKWLAFAVAFHLPLFIAGFVVSFRESARFDLLALSDAIAGQVLEVALVFQSAFLITAGLFLLAFFAVGSVGAELDNQSIFFLFERPLRRWHILLTKFVVGAVQTTTCVGLSILSTVALLYVVMVSAASNVTLDGSWPAFLNVLSNGLRGTAWTMIIALMVYSATFLFSVVFEKWWIAVIGGAVSLVFMFYFFGGMLFDWVIAQAMSKTNGETVNLEFYSRLDPVPVIIMLLVSAGFYLTSQYVFARKEMR
ncbi:MAG: ABC transporter permease [Acidobacteria bacterium]|nr:ABC transporter permease [Acidobacteriota bacterium]